MNDQGSDPRIAQAAEAIRSADALLIGAGAGLSAAAGYDFTSEERFARDYPGMLQYGFTQKIQMMAFKLWNKYSHTFNLTLQLLLMLFLVWILSETFLLF